MPEGRSKTIGSRSGAKSGCGWVTTTWWRAPCVGMRTPAASPTAPSVGPPVSTTRGGGDVARRGAHADDATGLQQQAR